MTKLQREKSRMRKRVLSLRDAMEEGERLERSRSLALRVAAHPAFESASCVAAFRSFGSEVQTSFIIERAIEAGKDVLLPITRWEERRLDFRRVSSLSPELFFEARFGILEPVPERCPPAEVGQADLVLVPGVAFDEEGGRLGYGGGFYDTFLSGLPEAVTVAAVTFEAQIVERVPRGDWDLTIPMIFTEARLISQ